MENLKKVGGAGLPEAVKNTLRAILAYGKL